MNILLCKPCISLWQVLKVAKINMGTNMSHRYSPFRAIKFMFWYSILFRNYLHIQYPLINSIKYQLKILSYLGILEVTFKPACYKQFFLKQNYENHNSILLSTNLHFIRILLVYLISNLYNHRKNYTQVE